MIIVLRNTVLVWKKCGLTFKKLQENSWKTQPWSYKAIKLYNDFGFNICKKDSFCDVENEYEFAMPVLKHKNKTKLAYKIKR